MDTKLAVDGGRPVRDSFLAFGKPCLDDDEINEVIDTLRSAWIGTGPKAERLEQLFAEYVHSSHALAVNSCTAALHLALLVNRIGPGDEVITTPLTFAATVNVIMHVGARPVFADIDRVTLNIDPANIAKAITPRTRAIIPVHFGGLACDMDRIEAIARRHDLIVVEDAAHATGARYKGRMIGGASGTLTCFSFSANKNLTTGEGGMITTHNDALAERISAYRLHGLSTHAWQRYASKTLILSDAILPGFKYNMPDLIASLGLHQVKKQERFLETRERYARHLDAAFAHLPGVRLQPRPRDLVQNRHALHLYVLVLDPGQFTVDRNQILSALLAENIGAALHYRALHTHPFYRDTFRYRPEDYPIANRVGDNILSLPLTPGMSEQDVGDVVNGVCKVLSAYRA